jgi:hypothetical protein
LFHVFDAESGATGYGFADMIYSKSIFGLPLAMAVRRTIRR